MCSWAQEEIWKIYSNVPRPPGKVMKASAWLNIAFSRSDIVETCSFSPIFFPMMSPFAKALGTTPKTLLPPKNATIDTPPINPRLPPPYTKWIFLSASTWPRWFTDFKNSFSFLGLDPQKTQIFLMWWLEEPAISTQFYICWMYGLSRNKGKKEKILYIRIENVIIPPICRPAGVSLSFYFIFIFLKKHVYVQVVVIVAHIFPWFYVQERLKRPLWVEDRLPIQFF